MNPAGALVVAELLAAAGVLHAEPRLAVMPDDARLGRHRAKFAGMLGVIEQRPGDGFADAGETVDTDDLLDEPEHPGNLEAFNWNARELDRILLAPLDASDFDSAATAIQQSLTDSVISSAVDRMPSAYRDLWGRWMLDALRRRRDALPEQTRRYYRLLAGEVDVWATDAAEIAEVRREPGGVMLVRLRAAEGSTPYFERRFGGGETGEVRLYLRGGDDVVRIEGTGEGDVPSLLVVREPGADSVVGSGPLAVYDHVEEPQEDDQEGDEKQDQPRPEPPRDWGGGLSAGPRAEYDADLGLLLGGQVAWCATPASPRAPGSFPLPGAEPEPSARSTPRRPGCFHCRYPGRRPWRSVLVESGSGARFRLTKRRFSAARERCAASSISGSRATRWCMALSRFAFRSRGFFRGSCPSSSACSAWETRDECGPRERSPEGFMPPRGAGVWFAFFEPRHRLSLAWASSREGDRWYLSWGLGL